MKRSDSPWERKRARTRGDIQRHALRLFNNQGYHETTVEQVAAAADLAPSTVFRHFPTKQDLATLDDDLLLITPFVAALREQPDELALMPAMRAAALAALRGDGGGQGDNDRAARFERAKLVLTVPELWGANLGNLSGGIRQLAESLAARCGRAADDPAITSLSRMLCGGLLMIWLDIASGDSEQDPVAAFEDLLNRLETGFDL